LFNVDVLISNYLIEVIPDSHMAYTVIESSS